MKLAKTAALMGLAFATVLFAHYAGASERTLGRVDIESDAVVSRGGPQEVVVQARFDDGQGRRRGGVDYAPGSIPDVRANNGPGETGINECNGSRNVFRELLGNLLSRQRCT